MSKVLFTAGVGDFIAIESWLTPEDKADVDTIFWASRARSTIQQTIDLNLIFPNLKQEIVLHDDWCSALEWKGDISTGRPFCISNKGQLVDLKVNVERHGTTLDEIVDYSVTEMFKRIQTDNTPYQGSAYVQHELANTNRFKLPKQYVVIHPYSINALATHRDFTYREWAAILQFMTQSKLHGVILGTGVGSVRIPHHEYLINLTDNTTIAEAIEITKKSSAFVGAASTFSVIASKVLKEQKTFVKGHSSLRSPTYYLSPTEQTTWCYPLWKFYYSPYINDQNFLFQNLEVLRYVQQEHSVTSVSNPELTTI